MRLGQGSTAVPCLALDSWDALRPRTDIAGCKARRMWHAGNWQLARSAGASNSKEQREPDNLLRTEPNAANTAFRSTAQHQPVITRQKRVWMPPANPGTRARAPLPSLRPLQVLLAGAWGGFGVLLYIYFFGAEAMDFGLSEIPNVGIRF
jgi:hypothetical protein